MTAAPEPTRRVPSPRFYPELEWLRDYAESFKRTLLWRSTVGMFYAADTPRDPAHTLVGYRTEVTVTGSVAGEHPAIGSVTHTKHSPPVTRVSAITEVGPWMNLDNILMQSDRPLPP